MNTKELIQLFGLVLLGLIAGKQISAMLKKQGMEIVA
jgi:hypothetical protein